MKEKSLKCWELNECGREPGGKNVILYGVCPAAIDETINGIHNGKNGGRCSWVVASKFFEGTFGCGTGLPLFR
ncbi:MAG: hypothetical protein D3925_14370 [Candidatus Electrothrix sp. AR5]|nr:hypothetical protein [Candidatus Electrothrix sp. AR5]